MLKKWNSKRYQESFHRGGQFLEQQRWREAASAFKRAAELRPEDSWSHHNLAIALLKLERWDEAVAACSRSIDRNSEVAESHANLGIGLVKLERWDEAAAACRRCIELDPGNASGRDILATALLKGEHWDEAVSAYRQAIEFGADSADSWENLGAALLKSGRLPEAVDAYRESVARRPDGLATYGNLAITLLDLERWEEAVAAYERVVDLDPYQYESHKNLGIALAKLGRKEEAVAAFRDAVELDRDATEAHRGLSTALLDIERWEEAVPACRQMLRLEPEQFDSHNNLALALVGLEQWQEAAEAFEQALELQAESPDVYKNLAAALQKAERWEDAASAYRRCLDVAPDDAECRARLEALLSRHERPVAADRSAGGPADSPADDRPAPAAGFDPGAALSHVVRGVSMFHNRNWVEASESFRMAAAALGTAAPGPAAPTGPAGPAPDLAQEQPKPAPAVPADPSADPRTHMQVGATHFREEKWGNAATAFRQAVDLDPHAPEPLTSLAACMVQMGRWEAAAHLYQRCICVNPGSMDGYMNLGTALTKLERLEEALALYRRANAVFPDSASVQRALGETVAALEQAGGAGAAGGGAAESTAGSDTGAPPGDVPEIEAREVEPVPFWSPENLDPRVFRIERWLERGISRPAAAPGGSAERDGGAREPGERAKLLFVLDNDYGELTTLMYLLLGESLIGRTTLLLPQRLYAKNAEAIPGRTRQYATPEDVLEAVDRERFDVVFLCSGYLFGIHDIFTLDALDDLVRALRERGSRVVTTDPFLGMLSRQDARDLVSIDIPQEPWEGGPSLDLIERLREVKATQDERLWTNLSRSEAIFADAWHLYPSHPEVPDDVATGKDARSISFYNPHLLCAELEPDEDFSAFEAVAPPHWLYILSQTDYETQTMFETLPRFVDFTAARLVEAREAGKHPILIGPNEFVDALGSRMASAEGIDILSFCPFNRVMSLLLAAEHAFYWNVVSHSILIRLFNGLPVVLFDKGHLVRNVKTMYGRVIDWYYQGCEPRYFDYRKPITIESLEEWREEFGRTSARMRAGFRKAPAPERMIDLVLAGEPAGEA